MISKNLREKRRIQKDRGGSNYKYSVRERETIFHEGKEKLPEHRDPKTLSK